MISKSSCIQFLKFNLLQDQDTLDSRLNLSNERISELTKEHLPLGLPSLPSGDLCQLTQEDYITGYSKERKMPVWTAFHMKSVSTSM